jgi:2-dehydropantoate 2-reductase
METESTPTDSPSSIYDPQSSVLHSPSTIIIVGAGGIGCAVGYGLLAAGLPIVFVETNADKIRWGRRYGVSIDRRRVLSAEFVAFEDWQPSPGSVVLLCTKCYDNIPVLSRLPSDVTLVPIQNGFDASLDGRVQFEGIASFVSECDADRPHARITRRGRLHFGFRTDPPRSSWPAFVSHLRACKLFRTELAPNILPFKYTKLMYNAAISPIAAAAGLDNGQLLSVAPARRLFFQLLQENYSILHSAQIPLGIIGPFHPDRVASILRRPWLARSFAWAFYPTLRRTYCSMSGDLPKGRTEIDYYNRHLIDLADHNPCPINRRIYDLVKRMEAERIPPALEMLEKLWSN